MNANHMAMSNNSPYTPPPAKFSCPKAPTVSFDVSEAVKRQQDRAVPSFTSEQIAFYKNAIAQLNGKMGSAEREFQALFKNTGGIVHKGTSSPKTIRQNFAPMMPIGVQTISVSYLSDKELTTFWWSKSGIARESLSPGKELDLKRHSLTDLILINGQWMSSLTRPIETQCAGSDPLVDKDPLMGSVDTPCGLSQQFSSQTKMQAAQLTRNRLKNRYVNVLPFDDNRVKLLSNNGSLILGDYINASFILDPVHQNVPVFIATQGPLGSTVTDFWQMAVQQKCPVIIMLTRLMDDNQERCAHYYPTTLNQSQVYGHLQITNKSSDYLRDGRTIQRILEVQNLTNSDAAPHTLIHLEFRDWPDFGVPSSTAPVREMIRSLHCVPATAGPHIVHCSAGIGRTGTFCTIDHSLRRILSGDVTASEIGQTVMQFRSQRSGMVQTKDQYRFVYEVLVDELEDIVRSHQ